MRSLTTRIIFIVGFALAGCVQEEPVRRATPPKAKAEKQERRSHAIVGNFVGKWAGASFYVELQRDRPEAEVKRPVLVEEDEKRREIGFAYLPGPVKLGMVCEDLVVVATVDELICYDVKRHEKRWDHSFDGRQVDDFVRRGNKLDVSIEGNRTVVLDLETGNPTP